MMDYINTFRVNGEDYRLKNNNSMNKIYTHMFKSNEVYRNYNDDKEEIDETNSDTGEIIEKPHFIADSTNSDKLYFNWPASGISFRLTDDYGSSTDESGNIIKTYYDGQKNITTSGTMYSLSSDYYGIEQTKFSDLNIKKGKIRVSYSGADGYTKKGFSFVLGIEPYDNESIIISVPELSISGNQIFSINFEFEYDTNRKMWLVKSEQEFTKSTLGHNMSKIFEYSISGNIHGGNWTNTINPKINALVIPNNNLPSIGTVIEFWADTEYKSN